MFPLPPAVQKVINAIGAINIEQIEKQVADVVTKINAMHDTMNRIERKLDAIMQLAHIEETNGNSDSGTHSNGNGERTSAIVIANGGK